MPRPAKWTHVASLIERRVRQGDYLLSDIPGERKIAEEAGVSHMTARKAVQDLLRRGLLTRRVNGTLAVNAEHDVAGESAQSVLLYPAAASPYLLRLRQAVAEVAAEAGVGFRPVQFVHWNDPIVFEALDHPGGTVVIPSTVPIDPATLGLLREAKVVILDGNLSDDGVPSIRLFPDAHVRLVFERLRSSGHRRLACLNTETHTPEVVRRIELLQAWSRRRGIGLEIWDEPAPTFHDPMPIAHRVVGNRLDHAEPVPDAVVAITFPAAVGAARACWERGLAVGEDLSLASINVEPPVRYMTPAIFGLETPDLSRVLGRCFAWFQRHGPWRGPTLLEPAEPALLAGESVATDDQARPARPTTRPSNATR